MELEDLIIFLPFLDTFEAKQQGRTRLVVKNAAELVASKRGKRKVFTQKSNESMVHDPII